jgi:hypothetical protein
MFFRKIKSKRFLGNNLLIVVVVLFAVAGFIWQKHFLMEVLGHEVENIGIEEIIRRVPSGWGWSFNSGWIKATDTDWGVFVDGNQLKGYGWSHLGWLRFDGARINNSDGTLSGTLYFCSPYNATSSCSGRDEDLRDDLFRGGWDGRVQIVSTTLPYDSSSKQFAFWGWGGLNVGWVFFNFSSSTINIPSPPGLCQISADPSVVRKFGTSTLSWHCENVQDDCTLSSVPNSSLRLPAGRSVLNVSSSSATTTAPLGQTSNFTISCSDLSGSGSVQASTRVIVRTRGGIREELPRFPN